MLVSPTYKEHWTRTARSPSKAEPSLRADLRLPRLDPPGYQPRLGEAINLPQLPVPKLPAPIEEDLSKGILESIDMDSYRAERQSAIKVATA